MSLNILAKSKERIS